LLRCAFVVDYLLKPKPHSWLAWAKTNSDADIARLTAGASKGRWWSVRQALIEIRNNWEAYSKYFAFVANADRTAAGLQLHARLRAPL